MFSCDFFIDLFVNFKIKHKNRLQIFHFQLCIGSIVPGSHVKIDDNKEMQTILVGKMADDKINKFMDSFRKVSAENSLEEMKQGMVSSKKSKKKSDLRFLFRNSIKIPVRNVCGGDGIEIKNYRI